MSKVPHPIPYQGSKRRLAGAILARVPGPVATLYEPFAGSGALTLAAAARGLSARYVLGDSLSPLVDIWRSILDDPASLADGYEALWRAAPPGRERAHYDEVRERFNRDHDPARLLYLLARCVKNAVRFNQSGAFNQSPDRRRRGTHPDRMRRELLGASSLLRGRARAEAADYGALLDRARPGDLVYMDPPYQGTSQGPDRRYHQPLDLPRFVEALGRLRSRRVPFVVSFDGSTGSRRYGVDLPLELGLTRIELCAGPSTQATLHGRRAHTIESLYLSPDLALLARAVPVY